MIIELLLRQLFKRPKEVNGNNNTVPYDLANNIYTPASTPSNPLLFLTASITNIFNPLTIPTTIDPIINICNTLLNPQVLFGKMEQARILNEFKAKWGDLL